MNKAILILDKMPKNCKDCHLWLEDYRCIGEFNIIKRPNNCPLKPLPKKKDTYKTPEERKQRHEIRTKADLEPFLIYYAYRGYNACIDEILGEKENG